MRLLLIYALSLAAFAQHPAALVKQADEAVRANDYDRALPLIEQALRADPRLSDAWRLRGRVKYSRQDYRGALADYTRAVELDSRNAVALSNRANAYLRLKEPARALEDADRSLALKSDSATAQAIRGDALLDLKRFNDALRSYDEAIRLNPRLATAWTNRAIARRELGDVRGAIDDYNQAESIDPKIPHIYFNRGNARMALKDYAGAEADFGKAIEMGHRVEAATGRRDEARRLRAAAPAPPAAKPVASAKAGPLPGLAVNLPAVPRPSGELWSPASTGSVAIPADAPPLEVPVSQPAADTKAIPLAEISVAMKGMRSFIGPLDAAREQAWASKWQAYFDYPDPAAIDYFRKLNPVLEEVQTVSAAASEAARDFDAAWAEAVVSRAAGDAESSAAALNEAARHADVLRSANARLAAAQKRVQALGNPPDPKAAKAKARAWSRKWLGGCTEMSRLAWLWRVSQLVAVNADARMAASFGSLSGKNVTHTDTWPAAEDTWCTWLDVGKPGPEPQGPDPSDDVKRKANAWVNQVYRAGGVEDGLRIYFFQHYPAEQAAKDVLASGKVVPRALPGYVAAKGAPPPAAPPAPVTTAGVSPEARARQEAEAKAKAEAIAEKEDLVRLIQSNLARDEAEWKRETDPARKEQLYLRVLNNQSAIQHERDLIQTLKTGEYVHTRTPSDDYCHDLMIVRTVEHMQAVDEARRAAAEAERMAAAVERMAAGAEIDQRKQLQDFLERQLTPQVMAKGDVAHVRKVAQAVFDTVQGRREQRQAQALDDALQYADWEQRARRVRAIAGLTLLITGIGAPYYGASTASVTGVNVFYGATTGTIDGGPVEGVKQAVAMSSLAGLVAVETMNGYSRGGLISSGGVVGAVERGVETFLGAKLVECLVSKAGGWWAARSQGVTPPPPAARPGMTVNEFVESQTFQLARNLSQQRIRQYSQTVSQIKAARAAGAPPAHIAELEAKRLQQAVGLNGDFLAKRILKGQGKQARAGRGDPAAAELEREFASAVETINRTQVDPAFRKAVAGAGFHWRRKAPGGQWEKAGDLKFNDMRHTDAGKTTNTDRDLALEELRNRPGEIYQLYKGDRPVKLADAEAELQQLYNNAYRGATGGDPNLAMQSLTTSRHREAYKYLAYTGLTDPANVQRINKGWAAQSAEVLTAKVTHAGPGKGSFATLFRKIDGANQAAKDIEKRLIPILQANRAKALGPKAQELGQDIERWKQVQAALELTETNPVEASRRLRVLTGHDSIGEVSDLIGKSFVGGVRLQ